MRVAAQPHRALYRRWRAQTFAEIVGQEAVVTTLRNAVRTNRLAHGLLFVGPRGPGKTVSVLSGEGGGRRRMALPE